MERHSMRLIKEVLRLRHECGLRHRAISAATGLSKGSVSEYLARAERAGLAWPAAAELSNAELEARLFRTAGYNLPVTRAAIDFQWVHGELRKTGVTLQLLWIEYQQSVTERGDGTRAYQYSQFCDRYASWRSKLKPTMRQVHHAGEKAFLDYSGKKPKIVDPNSGEVIEVELFVMVLGASNYTYAEATLKQGLGDFVGATVRGLEYFGCAPQIFVPDQLRSAVKRPHRSHPEINPTYAELGRHYGVAIVPARPKKPRDKAKVEVGVQIAQRWILARLRNRTFFSLAELNVAVAELLEELNTRPFQKLEGCRRSAFETIDRPAMKPLPAQRYEVAEWKWATANIDYHVMYDDRPYSVSHTLTLRAVEVRATRTTVEIFHDGACVVAHRRCYGPKGTPTTLEEHRPKSHRDWGAWPPSRIISWAGSIGPNTARVVESIMNGWRFPENGYRSSLGLIRSAEKYGRERTEAACARALQIGAPTRKSVLAILARGLDRVPLHVAANDTTTPVVAHENIRGGDYFDKEKTNGD